MSSKKMLFRVLNLLFVFIFILCSFQNFLKEVKGANAPDVETITGDLSLISELTAGTGGKYYSRDSGVPYASRTYKVSDYITDPVRQSQITSVTLVSNASGITANCTNTTCTTNLGTLYGMGRDVESTEVQNDFNFDWWRNHSGGSRAFYWTWDDWYGNTLDARDLSGNPNPMGTGGCDSNVSGFSPCPQIQPGGKYPFSTELDGSSSTWSFKDTHASIDSSLIIVDDSPESFDVSGSVLYTQSSVTSVKVDNLKMKFNFDVGPFMNNGTDILPHAARYPEAIGLRWYGSFTAIMQGKTYEYELTWTMTVNYDGGSGCTPGDPACTPSGTGDCPYIIGPPTQGTTMPLSDLDPNANGVIRADSRDSEKFNVLQGIPTSEY
ncbi:hypothetical protein, partial [Paenibacillus marchantiophytorum]|uniref:hypothetical protein n=1 Tax=Paenibacillus marchantiophytorum TaxID=1619310 RepID=UPI001667C105